MKILIPILCATFFFSCYQTGGKRKNDLKNNIRYDIRFADKIIELPKKLNEISGIAAVNDSIIACIADEKGTIYFYNINRETIGRRLDFTGKGDFEDITIIKGTIYVLESTGVLWIIKNYGQEPVIESKQLNIELPFELEGLAHIDDTLFVAAKYYHNTKGKTLLLPVWKLSQDLNTLVFAFNIPDNIQAADGSTIPFHTSAILFEPVNQEWYCLSTNNKALAIYDKQAVIKYVYPLSKKEFSQPEGICFTTSGDLLISNEAKGNAANILLFKTKTERK